jgi:multicomponent Na+:H+ antiporter subunit E
MRLRRRLTASALFAAGLIAVWYILSGKFDLVHLGTGVLASLAIAATIHPVDDGTSVRWGQVPAYLLWLLRQIVASNLWVARAILRRRLGIRPVLVDLPPGVTGDRALATLGISLTLTPGTLTVDVDGGGMRVHALYEQLAHGVRSGAMARRVARLFTAREAGPATAPDGEPPGGPDAPAHRGPAA